MAEQPIGDLAASLEGEPAPYDYDHALRDARILMDGRVDPETRRAAESRLTDYASAPDAICVPWESIRPEPPVGELPDMSDVLKEGCRVLSSSGGSGVRYVTVERDGEVLGFGQRATLEEAVRYALDNCRQRGSAGIAPEVPLEERAAFGVTYPASELDHQVVNRSARVEIYQMGEDVVVDVLRYPDRQAVSGSDTLTGKRLYRGRGASPQEAAEAAVIRPEIFLPRDAE